VQAVAALVGHTQFIGSVSVHVRPSAGPAAVELWEVRLSARMQHLLDDLDNLEGGAGLPTWALGRTHRYGVAVMNHKRKTTFTEQCKELHRTGLPGITVYDSR